MLYNSASVAHKHTNINHRFSVVLSTHAKHHILTSLQDKGNGYQSNTANALTVCWCNKLLTTLNYSRIFILLDY